jgi:hypothetical protein
MIIFLTYTFLAIFSAGAMLTLTSPCVSASRERGVCGYIQANNRAAVFPAILAAVLVSVLSVVFLFDRPRVRTHVVSAGRRRIQCCEHHVHDDLARPAAWCARRDRLRRERA